MSINQGVLTNCCMISQLRQRRTLILIIVCAVTLIIFSQFSYWRSIFQQSKPNVVLIIIDTLRADKLGLYGHRANPSPEIDQLGKQGTVFRRVIAQASWTRSSIGSFLTSMHPRTLGLQKMRWDKLDLRFETLPEILKQHGFSTLGVTANPNINTFFNFNQGFDTYLDSDEVFDWMRPKFGKKAPSRKDTRPKASAIFAKALDLATANTKPNPKYLQINIMDVHSWHKVTARQIEPEFANDPFGNYLHTVRAASRATGEFIESLSKIPEWQDTLFVIVSDHGEGLGDHPGVYDSSRHGNILYESNVVVPLIFYRKADSRLQGKVVNQPIRLLELMPTVLDYLNLPIPGKIEGQSVYPLLTGAQDQIALPTYFVTESKWKPFVNKTAIYKDGWKYIENRDNWKGAPAQELQLEGGKENGSLTDKSMLQPELKASMSAELSHWDQSTLTSVAPQSTAEPKANEIEQLKSLGYLQ